MDKKSPPLLPDPSLEDLVAPLPPHSRHYEREITLKTLHATLRIISDQLDTLLREVRALRRPPARDYDKSR